MQYYIEKLVERLEWVEGDLLLKGTYRNMKLYVKVLGNKVLEITGWIYHNDDWDIMYELIPLEKELVELITKTYLYEA